MGVVHVMPTDSAGGSMLRAIAETGSNDSVLPFPDDLSCGPIASNDPATRAAFWEQFYDMPEVEEAVRAFWEELESTYAHIVLWFGRLSANELSFFLACSERLADRDYSVMDVTAIRGMPRVSILRPEVLTSMLDEQLRPGPQERRDAAGHWSRLRSENAPFRVVTSQGLASAPTEHFDCALLAQLHSDWRNVHRVIADTIGLSFEPYWQVGDLMLKARLVALAESGRVELTGHPLERTAMVRLVATGG